MPSYTRLKVNRTCSSINNNKILVDDVEISTVASFELDKPYSTQRNGVDEITLCTQTQVIKSA